jgi:hypothetical protein
MVAWLLPLSRQKSSNFPYRDMPAASEGVVFEKDESVRVEVEA